MSQGENTTVSNTDIRSSSKTSLKENNEAIEEPSEKHDSDKEEDVTGESEDHDEKPDSETKEETSGAVDTQPSNEQTDNSEEKEKEVVSERVIITDIGTGDDLMNKLSDAIESLNKEHGRLKSAQLSEYQYADDFKKSLEETIVILDRNKEKQSETQNTVHDLIEALEAICKTLKEKLENENNATVDRETSGRLKEALKKAADAEEEAARTAERMAGVIAKAEEDIADIETILEAREAKRVNDEGETEVDDEETKLRKAEEKEKEEARKTKEESLKQEEEERKRKEKEEERMKKEEEERLRREEEAKYDPKSWPIFDYKTDKATEFDDGIICIVRAPPGTLQKNELICTKASVFEIDLPLEDDEELVSSIIRVEPVETLKADEPWAIAIPNSAPKVNFRETVVKVLLQNGTWRDMTTKEATIADFRDLRLTEVRTRRTWTLAVITRPRRDIFTIKTSQECSFNSSFDNRVQIVFPEKCLETVPVTFTLNVRPFDSTIVSNAKIIRSEDGSVAACDRLIVTSSMIQIGLHGQKFLKPVTVTMSLAQNPAKHQQPAEKPKPKTSIPQDSDSPKKSYGIGMLWKDDDDEDMVHILTREDTTNWTASTDMDLQDLGSKDIMSLKLKKPTTRILLLRTKMHTKPNDAEKMAKILDQLNSERKGVVVLRQHHDSPEKMKLACVSKQRLEKLLEDYANDGFTEGPKPTKEHVFSENQVINFGFRGNIKCTTHDLDQRLVFFNQMRSGQDFILAAADTFANKGFPDYHGFIQIHTDVKVKKMVDTGQGRKFDWVPEKTLIGELEINLPKTDKKSQKQQPVSVPVKENGIISEELFKELAAELNLDDVLKLAPYFELTKCQLQTIKNQCGTNEEEMGYQVLHTWLRSEKRRDDKGDTLYRALAGVGRRDLAEKVNDKNVAYRKERQVQFREKRIEKATMKLSQSANVQGKWNLFATKCLGLSTTEVEEIEACENNRTRVKESMQRWAQKENTNLETLIEKLQRYKFKQAADDVKVITFVT